MAQHRVLSGTFVATIREPLVIRYRELAGRPLLTFAWFAVVAYAVGVTFAFVNRRSIWLDEAVSVSIAAQPVGVITGLITHIDAVHALYYLLLHVWLYVGHTAVAVRMLSAIFALLALIELGQLATMVFEEEAAPAVIAILATSVFFIFYAEEARSPALALFACTLTTSRLWRLVRHGHARDAVWCGFFAVVTVYASVTAVAYLIALAASLAFLKPTRRVLALTALVALAVAVAAIPLALLIERDSLTQVNWIATSGPEQLVAFGLTLLAGDQGFGRMSHVVMLGVAMTIAGLMLVGTIAGARDVRTRASIQAVATWLLFPLLLGVAVDRWLQPILIARYFIFELVPVALLAGFGLLVVARRLRLAAALVIVAALGFAAVFTSWTITREDWRSVARVIAGTARPGDGIVFWTPELLTPYRYALREAALKPAATVAFPERELLDDNDYPRPTSVFAHQLHQRFRRLWLIESHAGNLAAAHDPFRTLGQQYAHEAVDQFAGIAVVQYSR